MRQESIDVTRLDDSDSTSWAFDYFILAKSNEERCINGIKELHKRKGTIKNLIVMTYKMYIDSDAEPELEVELDDFAEEVHYIECEKTRDSQDGVALSKINIGKNDCVGFDITGFAIPEVFRLLFVLNKIKNVEHINVFYTEPKHYTFPKGLFRTYEKLGGELTYYVPDEYGNSCLGKKEVLVCFLGFDKQVSKFVYDKVIPADVIPVNGFPSYLPKLKDVSLLNNYELVTLAGTNRVKSVRANNPNASYICLQELAEKEDSSEDVFNICVLGTKPMALGAALFALRNLNRVKISFPLPTYYNNSSSGQMGSVWCYKMDF